ncbi:hypothetical protein GIW74_17090 [Pseudomonas syringae]|nr:hypothetical protein [Pseudomonas syringae]
MGAWKLLDWKNIRRILQGLCHGGLAAIAGCSCYLGDEKTTVLRLSVQKAATPQLKCGCGLARECGGSVDENAG